MSIVFAAITPHTPLLLESIGKDKTDIIKKTTEALGELEKELYLAKPNILIVLSPHCGLFDKSFSINAHSHFTATFEKFGDLNTKFEWKGSPELASQISYRTKRTDTPTQLVSQENLDYGTAIPTSRLTKKLPSLKILPIGYSNLSPEKHLLFGERIKDAIFDQEKRVAILASGDLSHTNNKGKGSTDDPRVDINIEKLLKKNDIDGILQMNPDELKKSNECAYRSILMLLGILKDMQYKYKTLSYEHPFGVGYLTGQFDF